MILVAQKSTLCTRILVATEFVVNGTSVVRNTSVDCL